jgi:hypothetical protein
MEGEWEPLARLAVMREEMTGQECETISAITAAKTRLSFRTGYAARMGDAMKISALHQGRVIVPAAGR